MWVPGAKRNHECGARLEKVLNYSQTPSGQALPSAEDMTNKRGRVDLCLEKGPIEQLIFTHQLSFKGCVCLQQIQQCIQNNGQDIVIKATDTLHYPPTVPLSCGSGDSSIGALWVRNWEEPWDFLCFCAFLIDFLVNPSTFSDAETADILMHKLTKVEGELL